MPSEVEAVRQQYDRLAISYDRRWRYYIDVTLHAVTDCICFWGGKNAFSTLPVGFGARCASCAGMLG
jgi:hypothetical protein